MRQLYSNSCPGQSVGLTGFANFCRPSSLRGKGGRQTPIEWFKSELERQTTPAWNRAVATIAGAIRDAEAEARALATEAVEWRRKDGSETEFLATWAEKAEALGYFPCICEECGGPALASHAGEECLGCGRGQDSRPLACTNRKPRLTKGQGFLH